VSVLPGDRPRSGCRNLSRRERDRHRSDREQTSKAKKFTCAPKRLYDLGDIELNTSTHVDTDDALLHRLIGLDPISDEQMAQQ
jgi:hypothetical protein